MKCLITNSEINILGTLNATFTALLHAQMNFYSTGDDQCGRKTGRFTAVVRSPSPWQKDQQMSGIYLNPSYIVSKYKMTPARGKKLNHANK